jgi:hypothetical protein
VSTITCQLRRLMQRDLKARKANALLGWTRQFEIEKIWPPNI